MNASGVRGDSVTRWVAALCWMVVALDRFDLVVLGAVAPTLLEYEAWGLTPPYLGRIAS